MNDLKDIKRDILIVAAGELLAAAVMLLVYFFLHKLTGLVALSALLGVLLATGNYALMAAGVLSASKKAAAGDEAGAKRALNLSRILRYLILAGILAAAALSGYFDLPELLALLIPFLLFRPILTFGEFFRKGGEKNS